MSDREALAAARKLVPLSFFSDELAPILEAVDTRLAQLPEKCEHGQTEPHRTRPNPFGPFTDCPGKVCPAELVDRIAKALCSLGSQHPWEHSDQHWWRLMAVAVLDALNETP